jgi:S-methylmethionine-dependent homocysteine/selenocysteine methylase
MLDHSEKPLLLDGGMGRELRARGVDIMTSIWSANGLISAPQTVQQIHMDFISAGADIITANTYGIIRSNLAKEGLEHRFKDLNLLACDLAKQACLQADRPVLVAGSLPPLAGSFRPDLVGEIKEITPLYQEQADLLAPHVDLLLCETMSSANEARAAAMAACQTGKPVWVAWSLHEDQSGNLRSGESIQDAADLLSDLPVSGFLANCSSPESITKAMPYLAEIDSAHFGGYANAFEPIPEDWELDGSKDSDGLLDMRSDLDPDQYAQHVARWLQDGATVVGGCCGTGPAHIAKLYQLIHNNDTG